LRDMLHVKSPHELYELIKFLKNKYNILGVLISGGFDPHGFLPIKPYMPVIREVKRDFDLIVSVHSGFVDDEYAMMLREGGVDIVDLNVHGPLTMRDIVGLDVDWSFIEKSLKSIYFNGPDYVAPHILVGSYYGDVLEEEDVINLIKDFNPYILIFLSLVPIKGSSFENITPVGVDVFYRLFNYARHIIPRAELTLGCMRLRGEYSISIEKALYNAKLVDRIVLPNYVKVDVMLPFCCSLPIELEDKLMCKLNIR